MQQHNYKNRDECIAQNCFQMPRLATEMEDFVGTYMQQREGVFEREMRDKEREKALYTRKRREDGSRVLKLLRATIFCDTKKISEALSMDTDHTNNILLDLIISRKVRRVSMGGRDVYCLTK
jgi:hypothetical protein